MMVRADAALALRAARVDTVCMSSIGDGVLEGEDFGLECACGRSEQFERVVVQRRPGPPVATDLVRCMACRAVYHLPHVAEATDPALARDAHRAAAGYRKVSRPENLTRVETWRWRVADPNRAGGRVLLDQWMSAAEARAIDPRAEPEAGTLRMRYVGRRR